MDGFKLHVHLESKLFVWDLPLCRVLLEDEKHYPWLMLVPRRPGVARIMDLARTDQLQLLQELDLVQRLFWTEFQPTQINVAAIGNKTPQLHLHVIARFESDPAWPGTVWDFPIREQYAENERQTQLSRLSTLFQRGMAHAH